MRVMSCRPVLPTNLKLCVVLRRPSVLPPDAGERSVYASWTVQFHPPWGVNSTLSGSPHVRPITWGVRVASQAK